MSVYNLERLLAPARIAVIGAGADPAGVGHIVLRNLTGGEFDGVVYPIHPSHEAVGSIPAYPSVAGTPEVPDLAVVCTPAPAVPEVISECAEAGVGAVAVLSAGFRESGPDGAAREREIGAIARDASIRLLGPNCLGLMVPRLGLNASFAATTPRDGRIGFITQSGALATSVVDWSREEGVGFSHVITVGNGLDVDIADLIDYLAADRGTRAIVLYLEAVTDARKFMSAARAFSLSKPIVAFKSGRFRASAAAARSHTGSLAGNDAVYDAAFERAGIVRVERISDMFATAELLARGRQPRQARLGIVSNAGGPAVMAADALLARDGSLAELGEATVARLDALLPEASPRSNPVDLLGDASPALYADAVEALLADGGVDAVLVVLTPQAMTKPTAVAEAVARVHEGASRPLLAAWMGGPAVRAGLVALTAARIPSYSYPEQAVDAFMDLVSGARNRGVLYETPREIPVSFALDRARIKQLVGAILAGEGEVLRKLRPRRSSTPTRSPLPSPGRPGASRRRSPPPRRSDTRWCSRSALPTSATRRTSVASPWGSRAPTRSAPPTRS